MEIFERVGAEPGLQQAGQRVSTARMANAIGGLTMDAVQQANSGHPGMPMGMAEIAVALWSRHLKHNPANPAWPDRDRFVLSNGHGSMLLYSLLHLTGYDLPIEELRNFRQLHSRTPGHPEVGITPGVETTTGPLAQGLANAVGMALSEKMLAARFNRGGSLIVDHFTWAFVGDGCLMEGLSHEVCSLAGTLRLAKLVVLYDDNGISIDGEVRHWFSDHTPGRFQAYGWHVIPDIDGHDTEAVGAAIAMARLWGESGRDGVFAPTLIQCRTHIGKGSPARANTSKAHGEPLGKEEVALTRAAIDWPHEPFTVPGEIYAAWDARATGARREADWQARFNAYRAQYPAAAAEFERRMRGQLPAAFDEAFDAALADATAKAETIATRKASQNALNYFGPALPELVGGSADLTGSNLTDFRGSGALRAGQSFATGSEVGLALAVRDLLAADGIAVRIVSMPSTTVFDRQPESWKRFVLPEGLPRVAIEAGASAFWWKYCCEAVIGIDTFGESAPAAQLFEHFGFTPENVAATVRQVLQGDVTAGARFH